MPPPRIVVVSTYYHPVVGGCETHARQVAHALSARGFETLVLTRRSPADAPRSEHDGLVDVERVGPAGPRRSLGKWLAIPAITRALWRRRAWFDLIYCVDVRGLAVACWAMARFTGKPLVLQAETPGALSLRNWKKAAASLRVPGVRWLVAGLTVPLRRIYRAADAYTCIAKEFVLEGMETGIPRARLLYVPHAVDEGRFRPPSDDERADARRRLELPQNALVVMFVGRLGIEKGLLDLMHAWRMIRHPDAHLAVVGPNMPGHPLDAGPAARALAATIPGPERVSFHGAVTDPSWALRAADVFVQPSHYEAFGISIIEAMATALPIAASGVGGMRDFLEHDVNALITGPKDPAALAAALDRLLEDANLRNRLGHAARRTVEAQFTERLLGQRYEDLFRLLLSGAPLAPQRDAR